MYSLFLVSYFQDRTENATESSRTEHTENAAADKLNLQTNCKVSDLMEILDNQLFNPR